MMLTALLADADTKLAAELTKMYLRPLDFFVIAVYLLAMIVIGAVAAKRQTSEEMYFLGGRQTHWLLAGVSVVATLISTLTYLSVPGEVLKYGLGMYFQFAAFIFIIPFVNRIVIPAVMRLPVTSVYDYLQRRFSRQTRTLGASVFVITRLGWIGMILYTASFAIEKMTGWNLPTIVLVMGIATMIYTTWGGIEAVIWTDFAQFLILAGGAVLIPVYIGMRTGAGPIEWWATFEQTKRATVPIFSFDPAVRITLIGIVVDVFLWNVCTHLSDQVAVQRYLSTPSAKAAQRSMWVFAIGNVGLIAMLALCGVALFYFYSRGAASPQEFETFVAANADKLMPRFIAEELPAGLTGLVLAALLAAAMSSISSGINSISTVVASDFINSSAADPESSNTPGRENMWVARGLAVAAGAISIGMALWVHAIMLRSNWNLTEMIARLNHLFVAPLGALFLAGILMRRVGAAAAIVGFCAGSLASFLISFSEELWLPDDKKISFMWIMPTSFLVSLLVTWVCGLFLSAPDPAQLASLRRD